MAKCLRRGLEKAVAVPEDGDFDLPAGLPELAPDRFSLYRFAKAFVGGTVVAVALAAHRPLEPVLALAQPTRLRSCRCCAIGLSDGDVARPLFVRAARCTVLLQLAWRDVEGFITVGGAIELAGPNEVKTVLAHWWPHPTLADADIANAKAITSLLHQLSVPSVCLLCGRADSD